jgi:hypothetical protein
MADNSPNSIIKKLFFDLFNTKGYSGNDYFDFSVWFMRNQVKGRQGNYFEEILSQTPSENEDIIKFTLIKSFYRSRNKYLKIKVDDFVEEIVEIIINLKTENIRVDGLIKTYDAYETKNIIEQNLLYYDKLMKNNDMMKSRLHSSVHCIENLPRGEYKFSLMISYINESFFNSSDEVKEQVLNFRLNQIVKINQDFETFYRNISEEKEYAFQETEFYSYELKNKAHKFDSGTNMLYFFIKMENLSQNYEEIIVSEKKPILDVFLSNIKSLLNNFKQVKSLETSIKIKNQIYDSNVKLKMNVEFDPYTLSSIYQKIISLLQDIISYKVLVDHKYKTIMSYFGEIAPRIEDVLNPETKNDSGCFIY